jgi:uncharacterized protein
MQPTSLCNLDCTYCYVPNRTVAAVMREEVLEAAIRGVLHSELVQDEVQFLWHAGEPLLAGIGFYQKALELIAHHNARRVKVTNHIQTNATRVTDEWAAFFAENGFGVGVSIDGPAWLHDRQRVRRSGAASHDAVMRGVAKLRAHGIDPGALCVLTCASLEAPEALFDFFFDAGFPSVAFNVEEVENANSVSSLGYDSREAYGTFLRRFFDRWWPHRHQFKVREFDDMGQVFSAFRADPSYVRPLLEVEPLGIVTIQRDGSIGTYSPEFAGVRSVEFDDFVLANVGELSSLDQLTDSQQLKHLRDQVDVGTDMCRETCPAYPVCGGGFLSNRFAENGTLLSTETTTCVLHRQVLADVLLEKLS